MMRSLITFYRDSKPLLLESDKIERFELGELKASIFGIRIPIKLAFMICGIKGVEA